MSTRPVTDWAQMLKLDVRLAGLEVQARAARDGGLKLAWRAILNQLNQIVGPRANDRSMRNQASYVSARDHLASVYEGRTP